MYWNVLKCTRMYWNVLECTKSSAQKVRTNTIEVLKKQAEINKKVGLLFPAEALPKF